MTRLCGAAGSNTSVIIIGFNGGRAGGGAVIMMMHVDIVGDWLNQW